MPTLLLALGNVKPGRIPLVPQVRYVSKRFKELEKEALT